MWDGPRDADAVSPGDLPRNIVNRVPDFVSGNTLETRLVQRSEDSNITFRAVRAARYRVSANPSSANLARRSRMNARARERLCDFVQCFTR